MVQTQFEETTEVKKPLTEEEKKQKVAELKALAAQRRADLAHRGEHGRTDAPRAHVLLHDVVDDGLEELPALVLLELGDLLLGLADRGLRGGDRGGGRVPAA